MWRERDLIEEEVGFQISTKEYSLLTAKTKTSPFCKRKKHGQIILNSFHSKSFQSLNTRNAKCINNCSFCDLNVVFYYYYLCQIFFL